MAYTYRVPQDNKKSMISLTDADAWADLFGMEASTKLTAPNAWSLVSYVNRCVDLRAGALSALPWAISKGDDPIATNAAPDAIPWLSNFNKLLYLTEASLSISGVAYWYKVRNRRNDPLELRWFAPGTMTPVWDSRAGLTHFERSIGPSTQHIPVDDVLYFRQSNPMHETEPGPSPVAVALADANVIHNLNTFAAEFFERGAIRATVLTVDGGLPGPSDKESIKSAWGRAVQGLKNAFNVEVFSAAVKPIAIGDGVGDLENSAITDEKRESISTSLGVPHSLTMSNASNFATAQADRLNFYDLTVVPASRHIAAVINRYLFDPLGYTFAFQPDTLPIYQTDEGERATTFQAYVLGGLAQSVAAQIAGVKLPEGIEYTDLDPEPLPTPDPQPADLDNEPAGDGAGEDAGAKAADLRMLKKWLKRRGANADVGAFSSDSLSHAEKAAAKAEIFGEDGDADGAPFPVPEWSAYP